MKAPFVWFGGKRRVADVVWRALGDVDNYEGEHDLPGWDVHAYKAGMSYGNAAGGGNNSENRHKERLWFSPSCGFRGERQERMTL